MILHPSFYWCWYCMYVVSLQKLFNDIVIPLLWFMFRSEGAFRLNAQQILESSQWKDTSGRDTNLHHRHRRRRRDIRVGPRVSGEFWDEYWVIETCIQAHPHTHTAIQYCTVGTWAVCGKKHKQLHSVRTHHDHPTSPEKRPAFPSPLLARLYGEGPFALTWACFRIKCWLPVDCCHGNIVLTWTLLRFYSDVIFSWHIFQSNESISTF